MASWFLRKLCFDVLRELQYERPWLKVKGQPWPLKLIYSHFLIWFNISCENNAIILNSFQKQNFQKKSHLNALGSKFDPDVKKVKVNLGSSFEQSW